MEAQFFLFNLVGATSQRHEPPPPFGTALMIDTEIDDDAVKPGRKPRLWMCCNFGGGIW
jgi:hypothetical protein